jgi:hypothetical protein
MDWREQIDTEIDIALDELFSRFDEIAQNAGVTPEEVARYVDKFYAFECPGDMFLEWVEEGV